jgi:Toastrack DUF4097
MKKIGIILLSTITLCLFAVFVGAKKYIGITKCPDCDVQTEKFSPEQMASVKDIQIETGSGNIEIIGSDQKNATVDIITQKGKDYTHCKVTTIISGSTFIIKSEGTKKFFWGNSEGCDMDFKVTSPNTLPVYAETGSGNISITNWNSDLDLDTGSGDIYVYKSSNGKLMAETGSGNIKGDTVDFSDVTLDTGSGNIEMALSGIAKASTGSGDIDLYWKESPNKGKIIASTGSGNITLTFPPTTAMYIDADTGSGDFYTEIGSDDEAKLLLDLDTGSGNITVKKIRTKKSKAYKRKK